MRMDHLPFGRGVQDWYGMGYWMHLVHTCFDNFAVEVREYGAKIKSPESVFVEWNNNWRPAWLFKLRCLTLNNFQGSKRDDILDRPFHCSIPWTDRKNLLFNQFIDDPFLPLAQSAMIIFAGFNLLALGLIQIWFCSDVLLRWNTVLWSNGTNHDNYTPACTRNKEWSWELLFLYGTKRLHGGTVFDGDFLGYPLFSKLLSFYLPFLFLFIFLFALKLRLTAFVRKIFCQAWRLHPITGIDIKVVCQAGEWISSQQKSDGSFAYSRVGVLWRKADYSPNFASTKCHQTVCSSRV